MASALKSLCRPEESFRYYEWAAKALDALAKVTGDVKEKERLAFVWKTLGLYFAEEGNKSESEKILLRALAIYREIFEETETNAARRDLAHCYLPLMRVASSKEKALAYSDQIAMLYPEPHPDSPLCFSFGFDSKGRLQLPEDENPAVLLFNTETN